MNREFVVDIADLNKSSVLESDNYEFINYLDTSSLTSNKIHKIQRIEDDFPSRAKRKVNENTILYSTVRPDQRHFGFFEKDRLLENLVASTGFTTIDVKVDFVDPRFLYYTLTQNHITSYLQMIAETSVSAYPSIKSEDIGNLFLNFPDLSCQKKIAYLLSTIDSKIELNNRINTELEAMAKTIYHYWFVQFDFPDKNGRPYKSSGGKMVYNEVLKREIPDGWEVNVFNDWIKQTKAGDWGKEKQEGNYTERVYCIRGADINALNGKGEIKAPERFILKNNFSKALKTYDFIIEISGGSPTQSTGRITLLTPRVFERFDADIICSNFCRAISVKDEKYVFNFQHEWQRLYDSDVFFGYEGKTSGIKNFLFDIFMNSRYVAFPKKKLVEKYYELAKSFDEKKQINLLKNQHLSALRDWLLPMLMNGQVKVAENDEIEEDLKIA